MCFLINYTRRTTSHVKISVKLVVELTYCEMILKVGSHDFGGLTWGQGDYWNGGAAVLDGDL